jgi:hypothetical protein
MDNAGNDCSVRGSRVRTMHVVVGRFWCFRVATTWTSIRTRLLFKPACRMPPDGEIAAVMVLPYFIRGRRGVRAFGSYPQSDECQAASQNWSTSAENYCTCCTYGGCSPIVLDFDDDGYSFTSVAEGVMFDIDADGDPDRTAWTTGDASDAFLMIERNGRVGVQSGAELFGNLGRRRSRLRDGHT